MEAEGNKRTWKEKAVTRNRDIKAIKKRIKEITNSRDIWKEKYMNKQDLADQLQKENEILKKNCK